MITMAKNIFINIGVLLVGLLGIVDSQSKYACRNAFSCASQEILDNTSSNSIECSGFGSCYNSPHILTTGSAKLDCWGGLSCTKTKLIQHFGNSFANINCMYVI